MVEKTDNLFIVGRNREFMLKKISENCVPIISSDIKSYLRYLKSFGDVYILANPQDFKDYSGEIFPNFYTSAAYEDYFLPSSNVDFINYLLNYNDVFVLSIKYDSSFSYIKSHNVNFLIEKSVPKNILTIPTINGKKWLIATPPTYPLVSTQLNTGAVAISNGLLAKAED